MRNIIIAVLTALNWFIDYMVETWLNKVCAIVLTVCILFICAIMKDLTPLLLMIFIVPLFFYHKNVFD